MPKLWAVSHQPSHEDVFLERYDRLLGQALHITGRSHSAAEDLVHDAFIQFTLSQPNLALINDLDSYLFIVLRNMHLSQVRRTSQVQFAPISIADYDSAEIGLRAMDIQSQILISEELLRVCNYACARKESSKAASVLILRFFHGYYTNEIADVIRAPRRTVHEWLRLARNEVRLYLDNPRALSILANGSGEEAAHVRTVLTGRDLLGELRERIFSSRRGVCLPFNHLQKLYTEREGATIACKTLAHIVSCPRCLDEVNKMGGLPPFSDRYPTDMLGPDTRSPNGGNEMNRVRQAGDSTSNINLCRRRLGEVLDHQPQALSFSANGFILGSQRVNSEITEQLLSINIDEEINFVEVFSEQGIRLMFMGVLPSSSGGVEQRARLALDEGRELECVLNFSSPWPTLHVTYRDFSLKSEGITTTTDFETQTAEAPADITYSYPTSGLSIVNERQSPLAAAVDHIRRRWLHFGFWLRPGMVTAVFAFILVATVGLWYSPTPEPVAVSAGYLLDRATATEESAAAQIGTVTHRSIDLEEKSATGVVIARNKIEIWQSADRGIEVRRLYDERGVLIAGVWRRNDGVQTFYHHGSDPRIQLAPETRGVALLKFDEIWQLSPSAKEFSSLIGNAEYGRVEDSANAYRIWYEGQSAGLTNAILVNASLTLNRSDLHAIDQTLLVQHGTELREYRFVEASIERHRLTSIQPGVFEPDPALLSEKMSESRTNKRAPIPASVPEPATPAVATPAFEVEVLCLLNQIDADTGEQILVRRTASGILQVDGLVDTTERKNEILQALWPVSQNPAFRANVETVSERVVRETSMHSSVGALAIERIEPIGNSIPLEAELRRYFSARGVPRNQIDYEIQRFCRLALGHSSRSLQHAGALMNLTGRFSPDELRTLDPEARRKWLDLIHKHAQALRENVAALRRELGAILGQSAGDLGAELSLDNHTEVVLAVNRLFSLSSAIDATVRSALSLSTDTSQAAAINGNHFWRSLANSEDLAKKVASSK